MSQLFNRRDALKTTAALLAAGACSELAPRRTSASGPNEKLNLALIGLGGAIAPATIKQLVPLDQNIVALCDVDDELAAKAYDQFPKAKKFHDFRQMFDEMEKDIDAVVVSTPDHTHFHPAYWALERKKHLYLEKPMAHSVWETRKITDMARAAGVATQLGSQRHAMKTLRNGVEIVRSGVLGPVTEVYSWVDSERGMPEPPKDKPPVPSTLKWDLWLGPARPRDYSPSFAPYKWRFWWDFGTGDTGNWGCHILDIPFWSLGLKYPTRVDLESGSEWDSERTPTAMMTKFEFPADGDRGPITLHWGQGVPEFVKEKKLPTKGMNNLFVGSEGMLLCGFGDYKLYPEEKFTDYKPPKTLKPSPGFHREWLNACRGGEPATCQFDYSGPLAETVLLANVAFRARGGFDWDATTLSASNNSNAGEYLKSYFRKGWEVS